MRGIAKVRNVQGCEIPYMDPFDNSVKKYFTKMPPLKCTDYPPPLVTSNITHLIIIEKNWNLYNRGPFNLSCLYKPFRKTAHRAGVEYRKQPIVLDKTQEVKHEFVRVQCSVGNDVVYDDFFSFAQVKYENNNDNKQHLNVIIVGLDSVSRLNFHRTMPKTLSYLVNNLKAIEFVGFNKVDYNTFGNLIAMLTGYSADELGNSCWRGGNFDSCTFVWDKFKDAGYATAYCEDAAKMSLFNYFGAGFLTQPTTHDWTTFIAETEHQIGRHLRSHNLCLGKRLVYQILLDYSLNLITTYRKVKQKFFGLFWQNSLTHDFLQYPSAGDVAYRNYLKQIKRTKMLNDTVLIVMSDHGMRWGDIQLTHQGQMELKLPMLYIVLPEWFHTKYPISSTNIKENALKLITPFDLYKTLKDIAYNNFNIDTLNKPTRGISLFKPIPSRLCKTAGIPKKYCACQNKIPLPTSDETVYKVVYFILVHVNEKLKKHPPCSHLSVSKIAKASYSRSIDFVKTGVIFRFYTVEIETYPGNAVFVSSVKCLKCEEYDDFILNGPVVRKNVPARGFCVNDTDVAPYCHCQ